MRNILAVGHEEEAGELASWVQLEHYKNLDLVSAGHDAPSPEDVQMLRRKVQETGKLNGMLKEEEARNAAVLEQMHALVDGEGSPLGFLASSSSQQQQQQGASGAKPLMAQNVWYALTQLPALRDLVAQLKDSLQTLPNARHTRQDDEDSREATRRRYLDSQSQRAVERRGIDTDTVAKTAASAGRKIGRDEVEGVEALVQKLGGAQGGSSRRREEEGDEMEE